MVWGGGVSGNDDILLGFALLFAFKIIWIINNE